MKSLKYMEKDNLQGVLTLLVDLFSQLQKTNSSPFQNMCSYGFHPGILKDKTNYDANLLNKIILSVDSN